MAISPVLRWGKKTNDIGTGSSSVSKTTASPQQAAKQALIITADNIRAFLTDPANNATMLKYVFNTKTGQLAIAKNYHKNIAHQAFTRPLKDKELPDDIYITAAIITLLDLGTSILITFSGCSLQFGHPTQEKARAVAEHFKSLLAATGITTDIEQTSDVGGDPVFEILVQKPLDNLLR